MDTIAWPRAEFEYGLTFDVEESRLRRHESVDDTEFGAFRTPGDAIDGPLFREQHHRGVALGAQVVQRLLAVVRGARLVHLHTGHEESARAFHVPHDLYFVRLKETNIPSYSRETY